MTNKKFNTVVLTSEEFGNNLYNVVSDTIKILTKAGYVCVVSEEESDIIRIDFNYDEFNHFGNPIPVWFDERELEIIDFCLDYYREDDKDCYCKCNK